MPPAGVELHGEVAGAVGLEEAVHRPDSRPVGPHRVLIPGEQVHRGAGVHVGKPLLTGDVLKALHHVPEHSGGGLEGAEGVLQIGVHHRLVPADPVRGGAVGLELLVVGPQGQPVDEAAHRLRPPEGADGGGRRPARRHQGGGLLPGAGQDAAVHGAGVFAQVGPGQEGAHGVAQQEIGRAGEPLPHEDAELPHVGGHQRPAVLFAEIAVFAVVHRFAVAQVVLPADGEAVVRQIPGEVAVPSGVLRHAVDDLHHRPGPALRKPEAGVNPVHAILGGVEKFLKVCHNKSLHRG